MKMCYNLNHGMSKLFDIWNLHLLVLISTICKHMFLRNSFVSLLWLVGALLISNVDRVQRLAVGNS
jgi:hypothetical protein